MTTRTFFPGAFLATVIAASVFGGAQMSAQRPALRPAPAVPLSVAAFRADTAKLYTELQATDGAAVWTKTCSSCHESKDVTSADFRTKWGGRALFELYEQIRTTMPDDAPGTLTAEEYTNSVAYILKLNGLPAGETKLVADSATMSGMKIELPPPVSP
ncbi:c-type cytochrome [Gemmatimonas sp.]|jgi:cytochrome c5|uniref:c-type cytochrome n=1 Tax=Gemmatimonas sp. TaxID=1962908 RepID=UPI0037BE9517